MNARVVSTRIEATTRPQPRHSRTGCLIGETHEDAVERARRLYGRVQREATFDEWLAEYRQRALVGSLDEIATRLARYEGCDRVMLQHLLHDELEPVALIGRLGQQLV